MRQKSPAELRERMAALEQELADLRRRLTTISPASEEWARVGHLVDGLRMELERAGAESAQIQVQARDAIEVHRRRLASEAREIMARAETEAANKMQALRVASEPILAEANGRSADILQAALQRVRETIQVTGINLEELSSGTETVPENVLAWLEKADLEPMPPQFAAAAMASEERNVAQANSAPSPDSTPDAGAANRYRLVPLGQEGDYQRYQIEGQFTFASLLALEQAIARLLGARSVSLVPRPGGATLSLLTANPAEILSKLQAIHDFPMYV